MLNSQLTPREQQIEENAIKVQEIAASREILTGFTIDGEDSKDLDDGIDLIKKGDNYILRVFISDVTVIVKPKSTLFRRTMERVATLYRGQYNIPMLPRDLSENNLSLLPDCPRPVLMFEIEINPNGDVLNLEISKKTFLNKRRLSYSRFDEIIKKEPENPDYEVLNAMATIANMLLLKRRNQGALAIYDLLTGIYTNEEGELLQLKEENAHHGYIVIQEFMILANSVVAWHLTEKSMPLIFRNHIVNINAPSRNEIIDQIFTALAEPALLQALGGRTRLWLKKADYSPLLKGHFGLNLSAYAHITSPIRRSPDLINHILINDFIEQRQPTFDFDELVALSDDINRVIQEHKDEKTNYIINKMESVAVNKLKRAEHQNLVDMNDAEFELLIRTAITQALLPDTLLPALKERLETREIDSNILYLILFKNPTRSHDWFEMKKAVLDCLFDNKEIAVQIFNRLKQKNRLVDCETKAETSSVGFKATTLGTFDDKYFETDSFSYAHRKKVAIQNSILYFFYILLDMPVPDGVRSFNAQEYLVDNDLEELFDMADSPIGGNHSEDAAVIREKSKPGIQSADENFVGKLLELCHQNKNWQEPVYSFRMKGQSNTPEFHCTCRLITPHGEFEGTSISGNKKAAKQEATRLVLRELSENQINTEKEKPDFSELEDKSYVSRLMECCTKLNIDFPVFQYKQSGTPHKPVFKCIISIVWDGNVYEFKASGDSKKSSKHNAAEKCLKEMNFEGII
jgi:ribonuclease R